MVIENQPEPKRSRGRPRSATKGQVIEKLLEATEQFLRGNSHLDLTERKIASVAGVNDAMIHYYFGGKDKLLFDIIAHQMSKLENMLRALDEIDPQSRTVTRDILRILIYAYYDKPWIAKFAISEYGRRGSVISTLYVKKYGTQGFGLTYLRRAIDRLIASGVYDSRVNAGYMTKSIFFIVISPLIFPQIPGDYTAAFDEYRKDTWINHVADMVDCQCLTDKTRDAQAGDGLTHAVINKHEWSADILQ